METKIEITNDVKAKMFALYLGQRIKYSGIHWNYTYVWLEVVSLIERSIQSVYKDPQGSEQNADFDDHVIILKPLSKITDEDAIMVGQLCGIGLDNECIVFERDAERVIVEQKKPTGIQCWIWYDAEFFLENSFKEKSISSHTPIEAYQYLLSRGYDLPQYLLNGRTLKESGLAIYE